MINLLPIGLQNKQRRRIIVTTLTAVQLFIFLFLGVTSLFLSTREGRAVMHSADLTHRLAFFDANPTVVAETFQEIYQRLSAFERYIADYIPAHFYPGWFWDVLNAEAGGTAVEALEFTGGYIVLRAVARDIAYISNHRRVVASFFYPVVLGPMERKPDEGVGYELRIPIIR